MFKYGKKAGYMGTALLVLAVLPLVVAACVLPNIGPEVATKFNAAGEATRWGKSYELLALPVLAYRAVRHDRTALFLLVGYLAQVLPWVFISRLTFEYHYFAATLFLVLALGYVFDRLRQRGSFGIVYVFTAASGALLALFYPVLTGVTVSRSYAWNVLKWLPDWPF